MKDNEKLFVVFYIDVSNIDRSDVLEYMENARNALTFDNSVKAFYIPIDGATRIEVLNPRYVPESEYKSVIERFEKVVKEHEEQKETPTE